MNLDLKNNSTIGAGAIGGYSAYEAGGSFCLPREMRSKLHWGHGFGYCVRLWRDGVLAAGLNHVAHKVEKYITDPVNPNRARL